MRANFDNARIWGIEHVAEASFTPTVSFRSAFTYLRAEDTDDRPAAEHRRRHAGAAAVAVGPLHAAGSPLVGASRTRIRLGAAAPVDARSRRSPHRRRPQPRVSIQAFFRNGARARGWVTPGADGIPDNADDILIATGETLLQVQDRVLGVGVNSASLFTAVPGFGTFGVRTGASFGSARADRRLENLTDENYRGISWGVDAPGRGVSVRYVARF